jgi:hypothetical protein
VHGGVLWEVRFDLIEQPGFRTFSSSAICILRSEEISRDVKF